MVMIKVHIRIKQDCSKTTYKRENNLITCQTELKKADNHLTCLLNVAYCKTAYDDV